MTRKELDRPGANRAIQLFVLNLATALAISKTAHAEISRLADDTYPYLITSYYLFSIVAFLVATGLSVLRPRVALRATFLASLIAWPRYILFIVGFTLWGILGIASLFTPEGFLQILVPSLLLCLSTGYSYWAIKNEEVSGPLAWLFLRGSFHWIVIVGGLIACGVITHASESVETAAHEMSWTVVRPYESPCRQRVEFTFVEARGYRVFACSDELLTYLESVDNQPVTVTFQVSYLFGARSDFTIKQVGQWTGDLEERPFMQFTCRSDEPDCHGSEPGSPLDWNR